MQTAKNNQKLAVVWVAFFALFQVFARPIHYMTGCSARGACCSVSSGAHGVCCSHACSQVRLHKESNDRRLGKQISERQWQSSTGQQSCAVCEQLSMAAVPFALPATELQSTMVASLRYDFSDLFSDQSVALPQARGPPR